MNSSSRTACRTPRQARSLARPGGRCAGNQIARGTASYIYDHENRLTQAVIGGANQKIEGFHDVCRAVGFGGRQGVIIPGRNRKNLMLRDDVIESVRAGRFHIYAVNSVDEAMEMLTGLPAGERQPDGTYPEGTVNALVDARLREMGEAMRRFGRPPKGEGEGEKENEKPA